MVGVARAFRKMLPGNPCYLFVKMIVLAEVLNTLYVMYAMLRIVGGFSTILLLRSYEMNAEEFSNYQLLTAVLLFAVLLAYFLQIFLMYTLVLAVMQDSTKGLERWLKIRTMIAAFLIAAVIAYMLVFKQIPFAALSITLYVVTGLSLIQDYKNSILLARALRPVRYLQPVTIVVQGYRKPKTGSKKTKIHKQGLSTQMPPSTPAEMV